MASLDNTNAQVHSSVKNYYGKVLSSTKDLKTSACTTGSKPNAVLQSIISKIPSAVNDRFYGCGNPIPLGIQGKDILDLGSGSGRDCYIAAALTGPKGSVTGVDMTDEQLEVARTSVQEYAETLGYTPKLHFLTGYIEMLGEAGVKDASIDVCISNCVVNLSPNKQMVLEGVYRALREGGEFYFSDVYADAQLPEDVRSHDVLLGECIGGALYSQEFEQMAEKVGFARPRVLAISHIEIHDAELKQLVGDVKFYSITYRLFKLPKNDKVEGPTTATYLGSIDGHAGEYVLDIDNRFETNVPMVVSSETAEAIAHSWISGFFTLKTPSANTGEPAARTPTDALMLKAYVEDQKSGGSSGCCAPKKESPSGGCCPPKKDSSSSGCCAPKKESSDSCCAPKKETHSLEILNKSNNDQCCSGPSKKCC
ncbi:hypothetical protein LPJ53_005003 [Coemansia erecta]|uniref:Arsenite methyltransferase n=1 Tax=Coemansia erecta TaxID=147472 RepID=A0A9W7XXP1_9FUNG|nr:hypothetical protein LPJ53_005003 [Coemansia erecta]